MISPQQICSHLPVWSINTELTIDHTNMVLSILTPIYVSSSSGEINKVQMSSIPYILHKTPMLSPQWKKILWYSQSENIQEYKLDRKIYSNLGLTNVNDFNFIVSTNMISSCPISVADISNAENIYGSQVESLKFKSKMRKKDR